MDDDWFIPILEHLPMPLYGEDGRAITDGDVARADAATHAARAAGLRPTPEMWFTALYAPDPEDRGPADPVDEVDEDGPFEDDDDFADDLGDDDDEDDGFE